MTENNLTYQFIKLWLIFCGVDVSAIPFRVPLHFIYTAK